MIIGAFTLKLLELLSRLFFIYHVKLKYSSLSRIRMSIKTTAAHKAQLVNRFTFTCCHSNKLRMHLNGNSRPCSINLPLMNTCIYTAQMVKYATIWSDESIFVWRSQRIFCVRLWQSCNKAQEWASNWPQVGNATWFRAIIWLHGKPVFGAIKIPMLSGIRVTPRVFLGVQHILNKIMIRTSNVPS